MLALTEMPKSLVIVGAGVIGLEMAQIFRSYGAAVTLVEAEPRIAPFMDEELAKGLQASMTKRGIVFHVAAKVQEIVEADGCLAVKLADGTTLPASHVLIATGRQPDLSAFGTLPVVLNGKFVKVDATLQTSIPGVYAPGDANGLSMLAHAASKMGEIAAENALGHRRTFDATQVPGCIYGAPEAGWIGLTEAQARAQGEIEIGRFPFAANGRALCSGHNEGFVKIITGKKHQEILGLHILGPHASDLINEAAVLRAMEITATELAEIIHAHPTHAETLMEAAADALGKCLHLPPRK
jgi:dihydrolipoamide dehydrogenase